MKSRKVFPLAVITLQFIFFTSSICQTTVDEQQSLKPYDSWQGGEFDSVSLTNGGLSLDIPLASFPQRGNLDLSFLVAYTNKQWTVLAHCVPNTHGGQTCTYKWQPMPRGGRLRSLNGSSQALTGAYVVSTTDWWLQNGGFNFTIPPSTFVTILTANVVDPPGNVHQMGFTFNDPLQYPMRSRDATGILNPDNHTIVLPDGTRFGYPTASPPVQYPQAPATVTDANGNQISVTTSGWTDTMGRVIPGTGTVNQPTQAGVPTSNLSSCPSGTTSASVWNVPGVATVNGGVRTFYFCYSMFTISTNFGTGATEYGPLSTPLLSAVVLPNGEMWTLSYDNYGDISQVGLPTGGSISYTYGFGPVNCGSSGLPSASMWVKSRTVNANDGTGNHTWTYTYSGQFSGGAGGAYSGTARVTGPDNNDTVHTISSAIAGAQCSFYDTQVQYYQGSSSTGTLLKTVTTQYSGTSTPSDGTSSVAYNVVPTQVTTTLSGGQSSTVIDSYDSGNSFTETENTRPFTIPVVLGSDLEKDEYDFSGALSRSTLTHFLWQDKGTYLTNNFIALPVSSTIKDGGGCEASKTSFGYDETFNNIAQEPSSITMQHGAPPASVRGNRTSASRLLISSCVEQSSIVSHAIPFDTGEPYQVYDPLGNATTFTYDPAFYGAYLTQTNLPDTGSPAVHHIVKGGYDFNTGLLTGFTDENNQAYSYQYDDMLRLTQGNHPDGGQTKLSYPDPNTVQRQRLIAGATYDFFEVKFDGIGRTSETQTATPDCAGNVKVDTTYDPVGRVASVSNAYCATSDPTYGVTATQYDALGQPTQVTRPDGSMTLASHTNSSGLYTSAVETQDEGNGTSRITRIAQSDALGRLVSLCEVTNVTQAGNNAPGPCNLAIAATGFATTYQYDVLNNLKAVQQGAVSRSFNYDSLSRLLSATNTESGTTSYIYDNNGNVLTRIRPAPNQGSPSITVTTTYQYDPLNRLTQVTYSDGVTPGITKNYDTTSELGISLTNTIGHLSAEYTKDNQGHVQSGRVFSYDPLGRTSNNSQCTPGNCPNGTAFPITYTYDFLGGMLSSSNGAGVTFSYTYDAAERLATMTSSLQDSNHPATLVSGLQYNPIGAVTASSLGSALNEIFKWDCRARILGYASGIAPATPSLSLANTAGCPNASAMNKAPRRFSGADPGFLLASLIGPRPVSESFLFSGKANVTQDHGLVRVTLPDSNPALKPEEIVVPYREGETALTVAQRLAKQINGRPAFRLKATVRALGSGAILDFTVAGSDPGSRELPSVRVSVSGNRRIPSIRASSLRPPPDIPIPLGGVRANWREGQ